MQRCRHFLNASIICVFAGAALWLMGQTPKQGDPEKIKQADAAFRAGVAARAAGNLELAQTKFAEVVRLQPGIPEGHEALGAVLEELGKSSEAVKEFEAAAALKPDDEGIETNLALAYVQAGDAAKSIAHFAAALDLSKKPGHAPVDAAFDDAYGHALAAAGKPDQAADVFDAEEALAGARAPLEDAIGSLDALQGKWKDAQERFERAI